METYDNWRDVQGDALEQWNHRWPSFSPQEIACKGTGKLLVNPAALDALQRLRNNLGKPIILTSAYRSPEHNRRVGGARRSRHMQGDAFDILVANHNPQTLKTEAQRVGFMGFGSYPNARTPFLHVDLGAARSWGTPFPPRTEEAPVFLPEPPPRPVLATREGQAASLGGVGALAGVVTFAAENADALVDVADNPAIEAVLTRAPILAAALSAVVLVALVAALIKRSRAERLEADEKA